MVDLAEWEKKAKVPEYDPPQLYDGWLELCSCVNWYGLRSPWCPGLSCLCRTCMCTQEIAFDEPETWEKQLLSCIHPTCPTEFRGIYWLRDHIQATSLITLHECEWKGNVTNKSLSTNWVKANTMYGIGGSFAFFIAQHFVNPTIEISPNKQWMLMSYLNVRHWM